MDISNINFLQKTIAAFAGAFFAFLFIKLSEALRNLSKRKLENYDALVKIDIMANEIYEQLNSLIFNLEQIVAHFNEAQKGKFDMLSINKPKQIIYNKSVFLDLLNIDFANEVFSYFTHIEQHNTGIASLYEFKESFQKLRMEERITSENYMKNMGNLVQNINDFLKLCFDLKNETLNIDASCRVLMNHEMTFSLKLKNKLLQKRYKKKYSKHKEEQLEIIKKEIEAISKETQKHTNKITSN